MKPRTLATAALLTGCILLLQYHAIQFWIAHAGPVTGPAWSLLLEGAALWLWSDQRRARRALGAAVTLLLLAGPLYQVSAPLIEDGSRESLTTVATSERSRHLASEIQTLETALATYLNNSASRQGWVARIDHTQARIESLRTEQSQLTAARAIAPQRQPWQRTAVIGMEALAIVIFQLVAVLAIGELRDRQAHPVAARGERGPVPVVVRGSGGPSRNQPPSVSAATGNFRPATLKPLRAAVA